MTESNLRIVEARTSEQIADVRSLFLEYAESFGWDVSSGFLAEEIADLPGSYAPPNGTLLLAYVGSEAVGVLGLRPVREESRVEGIGAERFGELKRLFVKPGYRRAGAGVALMRRAEDEARARGYTAAVLTTVAELMPLAQPMYERLGYVDVEPYRNDIDWPQIRWMRKDL